MAQDIDNLLRTHGAAPVGWKSHWLDLPAGRMHYLDQGPQDTGTPDPGETLLFVHGNPTWCYHWRRLINRFSTNRRCVAMDHLGMGLSGMPDRPQQLADHVQNVVRLIDGLDLNRVTLVAQDWGGAIGLGALLECRERFERIVLFNTGAFPPPSIPLRINVCRTPGLGRLALQGFSAFSRAALTMTLGRTRGLSKEVAAGYLAPYDSWKRRRGVYDFVKDIPRSPRHPTWQTLEVIEQRLPGLADLPISLIWGMQDWCFTPACQERLLKSWPHAEAHRLMDVGHWVVEDAPEEAESLVDQFLTATATQPAEGSAG